MRTRRCRRRKIGKPFNLNKRQRFARLFGVTNHLNLVTISSLSFENNIIYCIIKIEPKLFFIAKQK